MHAGPDWRTLDYHVLRTCERLQLSEHEFGLLSYAAQLRLLAYGALRDGDERWEPEKHR